MVNIVLLCAGGMSSSLLVKRIEDAAKEDSFICKVNAYGVPEASLYVPDADCVLIGPQVRYAIPLLQKQYPDKLIQVMDMRDYGTMNGVNILKSAQELLASQ